MFAVGDRVMMRYGPGTVVELVEDASGRGREPIVVVHADVGQAWFCESADVQPLDEEGAVG